MTGNSPESFSEEVARRKDERETRPDACSHCSFEKMALTNYSRHYGGNVGAHWLCQFCEVTMSASRLGAGGAADYAVRDVAAMLNHLLTCIISSEYNQYLAEQR